MQLFTFFTTLALGCGAMAQAPKGISNFYCQIDHVDLENSDGICAAAGGRLEPLNGVSITGHRPAQKNKYTRNAEGEQQS